MEEQSNTISQVPPVTETVEVAVGLENNVVNGVINNGLGVDVGVVTEAPAKRKRGRPKKQETTVELPRADFLPVPEYSSAPPQKRGRGRPKGSGKWQLASSLGGHSDQIGIAGSNFTASIINLQSGEDIHQTLRSFSQRTPDSLCILSACGSVSSAVLKLPGLQGGTLRYEGCFNIVSLNGSHAYSEEGLRRGKNCMLSVHLVNQEGQFCGGSVVGPLIVGGPTMLVIGTFREQMMMRCRVERPKPKKPVVAVPLQTVNGTMLPVLEANGVAAVPPVPAPQGEQGGELIDGPDVIAASQQHAPPVDESDEAMNGPDANPALHQQAPPADDVYRVDTGPDVMPASPETADWNSLQPSAIEAEHVVSDPDIGAAGQ